MSAIFQHIREMSGHLIVMLPNILAGILTFVAFYFAGIALRASMRRLYKLRRKGHNVGLVLGRLAHGLAIVLGLLIGATVAFPSFTPARLIDLLGLGSVAIGFAFRDVLQNYLAGILLLLTEPFRIDDQIRFKDYEGTVEDIQTRATLIRLYDGRRAVIPNAELFTNSVLVNTAADTRRLEAVVGIGFGDDIDRAKQIIFDTLTELKAAIDDPPPEVLTWEIGESSINLHVRWWMHPPRQRDALDARDKVISTIKKRLLENGIDLPFPTRQILFHDQTESTDGDRAHQREGWPAGKDARKNPKPRPIAGEIESHDGKKR